MTEEQAAEAIVRAFRDEWAVLHPSDVPFVLEGEVVDSYPEFVRVTVDHSTRENASLGVIRKVNRGNIGVQVFTYPNQGTARMSQLRQDVITALENKSIYWPGEAEPVCTYTVSPGRSQSDGTWLMRLLTVAFRFDSF